MIYVVSHENCNDGFGAALSAWKKLGNVYEGMEVQYLYASKEERIEYIRGIYELGHVAISKQGSPDNKVTARLQLNDCRIAIHMGVNLQITYELSNRVSLEGSGRSDG